MYCSTCNEHLSKCTCEDLGDKLDSLVKSGVVYIAPQALITYRQQAERNKETARLVRLREEMETHCIHCGSRYEFCECFEEFVN